MAQNQLPQDSMERMLEQGAGQDPRNNQLLKQQGHGASSTSSTIASSVKAATSIGDPNAWVRELYGLPREPMVENKEAKEGKNHTPLDVQKVGSQDKSVSPQHKQFFKKYQDEYVQFLQEKQKKEQDTKRREEEEEKRRKEEMQKRKEQDAGNQEVQGKPKAKLGQPRRKATTEQHPETKAGGAK